MASDEIRSTNPPKPPMPKPSAPPTLRTLTESVNPPRPIVPPPPKK